MTTETNSAKAPLDGGPTFSLKHRLLRLVWNAVWLCLAAWTPRPLKNWRRFLLRLFGAKMGKATDVRGSARVWYPPNLIMEDRTILAERVNCYNMAPIVIRKGCIVSKGAFLCGGTHDIDDANFQLMARPIMLGEGSWIASEAFVGPGVTVGEGAVLGARAVTAKDLMPWGVYVGNPARLVRQRKTP